MSAFINKQTIKTEYGLTDSLIKKIGAPDKTAVNPHFRTGPPMRMYERARVEKWIEENQEIIGITGKRKATEAKPVAPKIKKKRQQARSGHFTVPVMEKAQLLEKACAHYNALWDAGGKRERCASENADSEFIKRICIKYLRGLVTGHNSDRENIQGRPAKGKDYEIIKDEVMEAIKDKYSWLFY